MVGLAASAAQFADVGFRALIGTIELLRRLKNTPEQMAVLLQDVDKSIQRIHAIRNAIQQPNSLFAHLSITHIQRVTASVDDACQTTTDLQHTLEPLFRQSNNPKGGWARKTWRSVVSVSMETEIAAKITRIKWLNSEVMSEMHISGLEMQAKVEMCVYLNVNGELSLNQIRNLSTHIQRSVEAVGQDMTPHFNSLITSNEQIQQVAQGSQSQLTQLQSDVVSLKNTVVTDLTSSSHQDANGRQQLQAVIGANHADVLNDSRQGRDSIMTMMQHESSHTRAELASLRDTLLKFMTGNQSSVPIDRLIPSRVDGGNNADLAIQVGKQLIKTPGALKDVCEKMNLADEPIEGHFYRPLGFKKRNSNCTCVRQQSVHGIGPLGISYDLRTPNATKCTYHKSHWRSWRYSLSVRLLPI